MNNENNEWVWDDSQVKNPATEPEPEPKYGRVASPEEKEKIYNQLNQYNITPTKPEINSIIEIENGIIPLKPLSVSDIIDGAFKALKKNPRAYFLSALVFAVIAGIIQFIFSADESLLTTPSLIENLSTSALFELFRNQLIATFITLLCISIITGAAIYVTADLIVGDKKPAAFYLKKTLRSLHKIVILYILSALIVLSVVFIGIITITFISFMLFSYDLDMIFTVVAISSPLIVIFSLYLYLKLGLTTQAMLLEEIGILKAIKRSWTLSKGFLLKILGISILAGILLYVLNMALAAITGIIFYLTAFSSNAYIFFVVIQILSTMTMALLYPIWGIIYSLIYTDIRIRKEALDLDIREALGKSESEQM
ncbi:hypothetical protein HCQ94_02720 [Actinomyces sp. zg-332]|uniref:hypothetical protein n=1 Tax=Actinomyces sp. zg-332 TaxID=2708340 RepID=UPI0014231738|nr:hypothetical protein [Actinomyces sp. zg-332]QPK94630.1 hypothetical protein HCQ94_02720 [Actinomyces sp. zg-332]